MAEAAAGRTESARESLELVCSEVWGGNRSIDVPIVLPGLQGQLYSMAASGGHGGDVHCMSVCGSGIVARMVLADVVGHGDEVAAVGDEMHRLLRSHLNALDQRRILRKLNRKLENEQIGRMTTAAMVTYFPPSRSISISYAGHPPAWLYRRQTDEWSRIRLSREPADALFVDVPLAVDASSIFNRAKIQVQDGDRLVVVTDGVLEAPSPSSEHFGDERLETLLRETGEHSASDVSSAVVSTLREHTGRERLTHDDVSLLVVDFVEPPATPALWQMIKNRILRPRGNSGSPAFGGGRVLPSDQLNPALPS
jgi:hypothetical protein